MMQSPSNNARDIQSKDEGVKVVFPLDRKIPLPGVDVFRKWLCSRFAPDVRRSILVVNGTGEKWKTRKWDSVVLTACHPDIRHMRIKTFHRILILREIASQYSVKPWIYILTLPDRIDEYAKGVDRGDVDEKISETRRFVKEIFTARGILVDLKEDETKLAHALPTILEFDASLKQILKQMRTPEELARASSFGQKKTVLTKVEKNLLRTYLFERRMLEVLNSEEKSSTGSSGRYSFISWGLEAQTELNVSYNIYDWSTAGAAILRKLVSIENDREYPGTIVLPDPLKISGKPMRYQVQGRDFEDDETLLLSDSSTIIHRKLVGQGGLCNVSNEFLNYLVRDLIGSFAPSLVRKQIDLLTDSKPQASLDRKQELVFRCYLRFIKPYYVLVERITCLREGLRVHREFLEPTLDALGSKRNRDVLREIATFRAREKDDITVSELSQTLGLGKNEKRSLYRNLRQLEGCGLVQCYPESPRFKKYCISGGASKLLLKFDLLDRMEN